jgi:hypothetical protein
VTFDPAHLHQEADASDHSLGHLPAPPHRRGVVQLQPLELETEFLAAGTEGVGDLGVLEQRLGGNAVDVQAYLAQPLSIDDGNPLAELARLHGKQVAGRGGQ